MILKKRVEQDDVSNFWVIYQVLSQLSDLSGHLHSPIAL